MIMFNDLLINYLQGKKVTLCFTNQESATVLIEDFIYDIEVDKKGNEVTVLWGIIGKYNRKLMTWRIDTIDGFELEEEEIEED